MTGEPNTKGSLYIDLGCVVEVLCCKVLNVVESILQVVGFRVKNTHNYIWNDYSTNQVFIMKAPQSQSLFTQIQQPSILSQFKVYLRDWEFEFPREVLFTHTYSNKPEGDPSTQSNPISK